MDQLLFLYIFLGLVAGVILDRLLLRKLFRKQEMQAKNKAKQALKEADAQAEIVKKNKLLEAKEKFLHLQAAHDTELSSRSEEGSEGNECVSTCNIRGSPYN